MAGANWERLLKFRCTGCGNCCKKTYICVTDSDVHRLMEGTGRPADELVRFARQDEIQLGKRHPWWVKFTGKGGSTAGVMVLKWTRGRCQFLLPDNRCGVYAFRPIVCRLHPLNVTLSNDDHGAITKITMSHLTECPSEWDGHQSRQNLGMLERLLWRESNRYIPLVEEWNRRRSGRRTPREFFAWLFGRTAPASIATAARVPLADMSVSAQAE